MFTPTASSFIVTITWGITVKELQELIMNNSDLRADVSLLLDQRIETEQIAPQPKFLSANSSSHVCNNENTADELIAAIKLAASAYTYDLPIVSLVKAPFAE